VQSEFEVANVDDARQQVCGWAYISADQQGRLIKDRQGDIIEPDELEGAAYRYVLKSRAGDTMHDEAPVATMIESVVLTPEKQAALGLAPGSLPVGWWVGFQVDDPTAWSNVRKGRFLSFSIGGSAVREEVDVPDAQIAKRGKVVAARNAARLKGMHSSLADAMKLLMELMREAEGMQPPADVAGRAPGKKERMK